MNIEGEVLAWHFSAEKLRDGQPIPPIGEWHRHEGPITPCRSGLHASERLIDALYYAPGTTLHRVTLRGEIMRHGGDKLVGRERRIEWSADAAPILRAFARSCALDVAHLWAMPAVVRRFLETGDEGIRAAAEDAARAAAWDGAWAALRDEAWPAQNERLTRMVLEAREHDNRT